MRGTKHILFLTPVLVFLLSACSPQATQIAPTLAITAAPTQEPSSTQPSGAPPLTEREVPRISVEEARLALDSGTGVMVDVRSPGAFEASHIAGSISVPLGEIEQNVTGLALDKDQWIITYCT